MSDIEEARNKVRQLSEAITGEIDGSEQDVYAASAAWNRFLDAIENAETGEELAVKFSQFVSEYTNARSHFADVYKDLKNLGPKLDPLFRALDGK